jgi:hypothetical protein
MVTFTDLPFDIINEILGQCTMTNTDEGTKTYIKIKYYYNKIVYYEYIGDMENNNPNGYGQMRTLTRNVNNDDIRDTYYLETDWLYLPFLSATKNFKPRLTTRFN